MQSTVLLLFKSDISNTFSKVQILAKTFKKIFNSFLN